MSILRRLPAGLAFATLCAIMVACGGYGSSPTHPTTPPSANGGAAADVTIAIQGMLGARSYSPSPPCAAIACLPGWRPSAEPWRSS
jgi:hypothetical protein